MTRILVLKSSLFGDKSVSSDLITRFLDRQGQQGAESATALEVNIRDLATEPVPHLSAQWLTAIGTPAAERSAAQQSMVDYSDALITELQEAQVVVIGAPMYNFTVPSVLKAWLDHVARAGVTFQYTPHGSQGLLKGKRVLIVATMGGIHEAGVTDHLRPYLKTVLRFLGLDDVEIVVADKLNMGDESRQAGIESAQTQLDEIATNFNRHSSVSESNQEAA